MINFKPDSQINNVPKEEINEGDLDDMLFEVEALAYTILRNSPELGFEEAKKRAADLVKRHREEESES